VPVEAQTCAASVVQHAEPRVIDPESVRLGDRWRARDRTRNGPFDRGRQPLRHSHQSISLCLASTWEYSHEPIASMLSAIFCCVPYGLRMTMDARASAAASFRTSFTATTAAFQATDPRATPNTPHARSVAIFSAYFTIRPQRRPPLPGSLR